MLVVFCKPILAMLLQKKTSEVPDASRVFVVLFCKPIERRQRRQTNLHNKAFDDYARERANSHKSSTGYHALWLTWQRQPPCKVVTK